MTTFTIATDEFRGGGERTEYHPCVAWDRLAEICGQFLSKGQLVDVEGRLQTRQWDDDAGNRHFVATEKQTNPRCVTIRARMGRMALAALQARTMLPSDGTSRGTQMARIRARLVEHLIRRADVFGSDGADIATVRRRAETMAWPLMPWAGVVVRPVESGEPPGEWIVPRAHGNGVLLYIHGGGWIAGSPRTHRALVARLAKGGRVRALSLEYRLAPEHPFPVGLDDCIAAYEWLVEQHGASPRSLVVGGDSAGGNLAIALLIRLRDRGRPLPSGAVLMSPALDLTLSGDSHLTRRAVDPYFADVDLQRIVGLYVGTADREAPDVSPLFGDLHGLPPILVHVGENEVFLDDALRFGERCTAVGTETDVVVWPGMMHVFQGVPFLPEAGRAIGQMGNCIRWRTQESA